MAALEGHIRELCAGTARRLGRHGRRSTTSRTSAPNCPSLVIAELLGVPLADRELVRGWIDETFHIEPGVGMINDASLTAQIQLYEYLRDQILEPPRAPPRRPADGPRGGRDHR